MSAAPRDERVLLVPSLAGAVGNLLEWYDFGLYGLFAPIFAQLFFPGQDHIASLIGAIAALQSASRRGPLAPPCSAIWATVPDAAPFWFTRSY